MQHTNSLSIHFIFSPIDLCYNLLTIYADIQHYKTHNWGNNKKSRGVCDKQGINKPELELQDLENPLTGSTLLSKRPSCHVDFSRGFPAIPHKSQMFRHLVHVVFKLSFSVGIQNKFLMFPLSTNVQMQFCQNNNETSYKSTLQLILCVLNLIHQSPDTFKHECMFTRLKFHMTKHNTIWLQFGYTLATLCEKYHLTRPLVSAPCEKHFLIKEMEMRVQFMKLHLNSRNCSHSQLL